MKGCLCEIGYFIFKQGVRRHEKCVGIVIAVVVVHHDKISCLLYTLINVFVS